MSGPHFAKDVETLRRLIDAARRGCAPYRPHDVVLDGERAERLVIELERIPELERENARLSATLQICGDCGAVHANAAEAIECDRRVGRRG